MPAADIPSAPIFTTVYFDKWVHAGLFGMLVLLTCFPFFSSKYASLSLFIKITLGCVLYGVAMEFVQKYCTTDRDFDVLDMAADATGAVISCAIINVRYRRYVRKRQAGA